MTALVVERVGYRYPSIEGGAPFALQGVEFSLKEGDMLGILGPNGAGKSTLLRLLMKALPLREGRVVVCGQELDRLSCVEAARLCAWVPQELESLFVLSVEDMVALGRYCRTGLWGRLGPEDRRQVTRAIEETDLGPLRHRPVNRLSGGEKRRVLLARALAQEPRVLLLDEPTAHLDPGHQAGLVTVIDRLRHTRGLAVAAVLHDVNLAMAWCPRALLLKSGRMSALGDTARVLTPAHLKEVYGLNAVVQPAVPGRPGTVQFLHHSIERIQP